MTETGTLTLTEFLLARITEDEGAARLALNVPAYEHYGDTAAEECWRMAKSEGCSSDGYRFHRGFNPTRVLAECEAKRWIVEDYRAAVMAACDESDHDSGWMKHGAETALAATLSVLATTYADHPDYREEWRV